MSEIFTLRHQNQYNLRNWIYFDVLKLKLLIMILRVLDISVLRFGKLYQHIYTTDKFKIAIKKWKKESCPCRLCKVYLQNIGYI